MRTLFTGRMDDTTIITITGSPPSRFYAPSPRTVESTGVHGIRLPAKRYVVVYSRLSTARLVAPAAAAVCVQHANDTVVVWGRRGMQQRPKTLFPGPIVYGQCRQQRKRKRRWNGLGVFSSWSDRDDRRRRRLSAKLVRDMR